MSVNTSEEYLDELLQAIEPIIYKNEPEPITVDQAYSAAVSEDHQAIDTDVETQTTDVPDIEEMPQDFVSSETFGISDSPVEEEGISLDNLVADDSISLESLVAEAEGEPLPVAEDLSETEVSMDDLLAALTSEENAEVEELDVDAMISAAAEAAGESDAFDPSAHDNDVKELLKQFSDDEDLSDIGDILARDENSEAVDESVLLTPDVEVFQLEENTEEEEEAEPVKEKKGLFSLFKKNKKKKKKEQVGESEETVVENRDTVELDEEASVDLLMPEENVHIDQSPRSDVAVETDSMDAMDISSLMDLGDTGMAVEAGGELELGNLFGDGDMADIDQLLAAGSFEEIGSDELLRDKNETKAEASKDGKKGSFFSRFMNMLLEEEEEETDSKKAKKKGNVPEADATGVTDENLGILDELSKEDKKKAKKEKKEQKKKEKEAKKKGKAAPDGEEEQEGEEGAEAEDKKKKKVKKEKPRKVVDIDQKPEKKLSRRKVSIVFLFCFSILAVILLFKNVVLDLSNLKDARWAFDNADYETCYANLYGEELSEEDEEIFQKSYIILCVQRKLDSYENFIRMDMGVEALNALFDGVRVYRDMETRAGELGILDRISGIYQTIYAKLGEYGLSNEEIEEILDYDSKVTYTKRLDSIVNGTPFDVEEGIWEKEVQAAPEPQPLEDVLPQEEDFLPEDTSNINTVTPAIDDVEPKTTVVVGSSPVDVSGVPGADASNGGVNVGSGDTNVSATVNGDGVVVF